MDREDIAEFSGMAAEERAEGFGTKVEFRGGELKLPLQNPPPEMELTSGGWTGKVAAVARFPVSTDPVPRQGEPVKVVATGVILRVLGVLPFDTNNPLSGEILVALRTA